MSKIYPPTSTATYRQCPRMWALEQMGWLPNYFSYPNIAMATGIGVHKGAEYLHRSIISGHKYAFEQVDIATQCSVTAGLESISKVVEKGVHPVQKVEDWQERVRTQTEKGTRAYYKHFREIIPEDWKLLTCEESWGYERGEEGYIGTLDLLLEDDYGPAVVDIKTKSPFRSEYYREMFIKQFAYSWQMYHYTWMSWQKLNIAMPKRFYLVMVEMAAKPKVTIHPYLVDVEYMNHWKMTAGRLWEEMEAIEEGELIPGISDTHMFYGSPCKFEKACFEHKLDEQLMLNDYVQIEV